MRFNAVALWSTITIISVTVVGCLSGGGSSGAGAAAGLNERPQNLTCTALPSTSGDPAIALAPAFPDMPPFQMPVGMFQPPQDSSRWYVIEKSGTVKVFDNRPDVAQAGVYIDLTGKVDSRPNEAGLLGMAFSPDFASTGSVYLSYTGPGSPLISYISRFQAGGPNTLRPDSEQILLQLPQPFENHNGGDIVFGPDGDLYAGFGDGGYSGDQPDPEGNGQNPKTIFGTIIRIAPHDPTPNAEPHYGVPPDNPFANGSQGAPEVYAWGLRNPWRFSFDRQTGMLWAGDVGEGSWEEIDHIQKGGDYGWSVREGAHCYPESVTSCNTAGLIDPIAEYSHSEGCAITGGYVYRGSAIPQLQGVYIYGDYCSGRIWGLLPGGQGLQPKLLLENGKSITSFAQGNDGELYVIDGAAGTISKIVPGPTGGGSQATSGFPERLSQTGCANRSDPVQAVSGMMPYTVNAAFWSDGAQKQRWFAIPDGTTITMQSDGQWRFPAGSVLRKDFLLDGKPVETRLLARSTDGIWSGYSYQWSADGSDALLVKGGKTAVVNGHQWTFPSSAQCMECHTSAAGHTLGLTTGQLNSDFTYPSTGRRTNQLTTLEAIHMISPPLPGPPANLTRIPDPFGDAPLDQRARAYLQSNCAQCHRPNGPTPAAMDLRFGTETSNLGICGVPPQLGDLGISDALLLAPGHPEKSVLVARADRRDAQGMPPLGSHVVDTHGVALLSQWIEAMKACP